jgi:phosphotriesterase-related protein
VLGEEGVEPRHVLLAHVGDSTDVDLLTELAEAGFLLGMDRFGIDAILDLGGRAGTVAELCRRGLASRMVLSHDASCYIDWIDPNLLVAATNWHYLHITNDVLPALAERGVTDDQIDQMLVANPRAWFER